LAASRPVVVPATAGPAEIVDSAGGVLYPPGDATAAADALVDVLSSRDRAAQIGAAGRERARREFDAVNSRARYGAVVRRAMASRPHSGPDRAAVPPHSRWSPSRTTPRASCRVCLRQSSATSRAPAW